mmetsp:Transcript_11983/g.25303  ORF Transcript_11983/g.25303 Transcript_11983/m.25303 type:complete len:482 (-) Transcript_11983:144-1589(-)
MNAIPTPNSVVARLPWIYLPRRWRDPLPKSKTLSTLMLPAGQKLHLSPPLYSISLLGDRVLPRCSVLSTRGTTYAWLHSNILHRVSFLPNSNNRLFGSTSNIIGHDEDIQSQGVRIASLLSKHLGTSRRQSERMVLTERVTLFGEVVTSPSHLLYPSKTNGDAIAIKVDGRLLHGVEATLTALAVDQAREAKSGFPNCTSGKGIKSNFKKQIDPIDQNISSSTRVWLANKLRGELVTEDDPVGRPSMLQRLTRGGVGSSKVKGSPHIHLKPVGRLDMMTEGLMVFTNDGKYARALELPSNKLWRTYRIRVHGRLTVGKLRAMRKGMTVRVNDGIAGEEPSKVTGKVVKYKGMKVNIERKALSKSLSQRRGTKSRGQRGGGGTNTWLQITCTEGKNRQLRRILGSLGLDVTRLIRISYGDYDLNTIPPGLAVEVPVKKLATMKKQGPLFTNEGEIAGKPRSNKYLDGVDTHSTRVEWVTYYS